MATPRRRAHGWTLALAAALVAATGPALAEARLRADLRARLGLSEDFAINLDLGGLELRGLRGELADGRGFVEARRVHVRPDFDGVTVEIEGLDGELLRRAATKPTAPGPRPGRARASEPPPPPAEARTDPLADLLTRLRGIPVHLRATGSFELELGAGVQAHARAVELSLSAAGEIHGEAELELHARALAVGRASVELETTAARPRDVSFSGELVPGGSPASRSLAIAGHATPERVDARVRTREGAGQASVTLHRGERSARGRADRLRVDAESLPLASLEPLLLPLTQRLSEALGERDGELILDDARLSGGVELVRSPEVTRARFDGVELSGARVSSSLLAAEALELDALGLDGELARAATPAGPRSFATLVLEHRGVQLQVSGQLDPAGIELDLALPPTPCQAVFDATPGISPVLAGTELSGELEASIGLSLNFAALERARARYLGDDAEALELEDFDAPGQLRFELPYLERCTIERLGSRADVEGLDGPYRHDFVSASGHAQRRVLTNGDPNYVRIDQVPRLALAFVILEDARFWHHDGFDREQLERAFWFNLLEGRVHRGASTISQQTARTLWLGTDRSVARKLSEAILAAELERQLHKRRILEIYLNVIELGPEIHGVTEAARYHFGKEPHELELIEALHLASLAPAPVAYSRRFADGTVDRAWRDHLARQVHRLRIRHSITDAVAEQTKRARLKLRAHPELAPATHPRKR